MTLASIDLVLDYHHRRHRAGGSLFRMAVLFAGISNEPAMLALGTATR